MRWWDIATVMVIENGLFEEDAWSEGMFWSELAERETRRYLVEDDDAGKLCAYAGLCTYAPHEAYIQTIAVSPVAQRRGIGDALLTELISESVRRGCPHLDLEVRADNDTAIRLYERHGFTRIGLRRGYYQPSNTDAAVMRRLAA
ncbi:MAG TPA: ribosomal protein S18-alanine N-acetyltransferase [Mycobacteriales bacterium]|jgi:ribosomal-protein-alanine N-acetyltransferase|nr:ribosomal protein S18-alanine N-acetyltransferase [Mycobacteriales bacterium]